MVFPNRKHQHAPPTRHRVCGNAEHTANGEDLQDESGVVDSLDAR